jgi:hypothetical protein
MSRMSKRPRKAAPKSNRRLSPEERLARNIAQENRTPEQSNRRRNAGHAKPLRPDAGETKQPQRTPSPIGQWLSKVFSPVRDSLTGEWLGGPEVIRHLPFLGFLVVLILGYTYLEYQYEYDERAIKEGRKELRNLRHHEQSLRGRFESQLQRSRLDEDMADAGLSAPKAPPTTLPNSANTAP